MRSLREEREVGDVGKGKEEAVFTMRKLRDEQFLQRQEERRKSTDGQDDKKKETRVDNTSSPSSQRLMSYLDSSKRVRQELVFLPPLLLLVLPSLLLRLDRRAVPRSMQHHNVVPSCLEPVVLHRKLPREYPLHPR
eukprot:747808-Hanusia_phi.AAC.1